MEIRCNSDPQEFGRCSSKVRTFASGTTGLPSFVRDSACRIRMLATILPPQRDISEEKAKFINKNQNKTESNASSVRSQLQYSQLQTAVCRTPLVKQRTFRKNITPPTSEQKSKPNNQLSSAWHLLQLFSCLPYYSALNMTAMRSSETSVRLDLHGFTTQRTIFFMFTSVRTSNPSNRSYLNICDCAAYLEQAS